MTVSEVLRYYAEEHLGEIVDSRRAKIAAGHLNTAWANRPVASLAKKDFEFYRQKRGVAPSTVNRELAVLRAAIMYARKAGLESANPHVPRTMESRRVDWLEPADVEKLLEAARPVPHLYAYLIVSLYTGQRKEAVLSLRWNQVDFRSGIIHFTDHTMFAAHRRKNRGTVPIAAPVRELLVALQAEAGPCPYVIQCQGQRLMDVRKPFAEAVKRAGLTGKITPHVLRHTVASNLLGSGRPLLEVSRLLGHRDSSITERVYGHFAPAFVQQSVDQLEQLFGSGR